MDLIKIGKFIAELRKKNNMTQEQLAEKMGVSDRAVSKWERGLSLPDASLMIPLCNELNIKVNELLCGKMIEDKEYQKKTENLLIEMAKKEEQQKQLNKKLMSSMITIIITNTLFYLGILCLAINILEVGTLLWTIICSSTLLYIIAVHIALKFEVKAGYYECMKCHHRFVPTYKEVLLALHAGTIRYLKCPKCGKRSWTKKVMSK